MSQVLNISLVVGIILAFCLFVWFVCWLIDKILTNHYQKQLLKMKNRYSTFYQKQEELHAIEWGTSYEELKEIENQIDDLRKELNYALQEDCPKIEEKIEILKGIRKEKKEQFELAKEKVQELRKEIREIENENPELKKFHNS